MKAKQLRNLLCLALAGVMLLTGCGQNGAPADTGSTKESGVEDETKDTAAEDGTEETSTEDAGGEDATDSDAGNAAAGEGGKGPIVDEMVNYTLACQLSPNWGNPADGEFWKKLEEETNIHIEWVTYLETEAEEKFKLLMASGDYPDGFIGALG